MARTSPPHVLAIDASPAVLDALRDLLERQGYQVTSRFPTETDLAAIAALAPDLILLGDVGVDEGTCWSQLRADPSTKAIPLILSTTSTSAGGEAAEVEQHLTEPSLWVVPRPFDLDVLLATIHAALRPSEGKT